MDAKNATLTPAIELLETVRESGIAPSQLKKLIELARQKNLSKEQVSSVLQSPYFPDLLEAAKNGTLAAVDRTIFRHVLGLSPTVDGKEAPQKRLRRLAEIALPGRAEAFDPSEFYRNREGLHVGDSFPKYILAAANPCESVPAATFAVYELVESLNDNEIQVALPAGSVFEDASMFCAFLAAMLDRQKNGAGGGLVANSYANIFYVRGKAREGFAVSAGWNAGYRGWHVLAFRFDGVRWPAGARVLSSNC